MNKPHYFILAGILLIVTTLLIVIFPVQFIDFKIISLPVLVSGGILVIFGLVWQTKKAALTDNQHKIFDEPQAETISMAYISLKWRCLKVNKLFCQLLGYEARELSKMDFQRLIHPDDFKKDLLSIQKILEDQQQTHQSQQRYLDKNGDLVSLSVTISLARDKERKPLYFVCQFQKPHTLTSSHSTKAYSTTA